MKFNYLLIIFCVITVALGCKIMYILLNAVDYIGHDSLNDRDKFWEMRR
jgi:hypothetical protein